MNIDIGVISFLLTLLGIAVGYGMFKGQMLSVRSQVKKIWEWKDEHEKEANEKRIEIIKEIGRVDAQLASKDSQYNEIISKLNDMKEDVSEIKKDVAEIMSGKKG